MALRAVTWPGAAARAFPPGTITGPAWQLGSSSLIRSSLILSSLYFASIHKLSEWLLNSGAYMHWMAAKPV